MAAKRKAVPTYSGRQRPHCDGIRRRAPRPGRSPPSPAGAGKADRHPPGPLGNDFLVMDCVHDAKPAGFVRTDPAGGKCQRLGTPQAGDAQVVHKQTVARYVTRDVGTVQLRRAAALAGVTPDPMHLQAPHAGEHGANCCGSLAETMRRSMHCLPNGPRVEAPAALSTVAVTCPKALVRRPCPGGTAGIPRSDAGPCLERAMEGAGLGKAGQVGDLDQGQVGLVTVFDHQAGRRLAQEFLDALHVLRHRQIKPARLEAQADLPILVAQRVLGTAGTHRMASLCPAWRSRPGTGESDLRPASRPGRR